MSVPAPPKNTDAKNQNSLGAQIIPLIVGVLIQIFAWWLPADVSQKKKNIIFATVIFIGIVIVWIAIKKKQTKRNPLLTFFTVVIVIICINVSMSILIPLPEPTPTPSQTSEPTSTPLQTSEPTPEPITIHALVSNTGVKLEFPEDTEYVETPFVMYVNTGTDKKDGSILLMPRPESGKGYLIDERDHEIVVFDGQAVTILAEHGLYYFFQTEDGYGGWNGMKWFTPTP